MNQLKTKIREELLNSYNLGNDEILKLIKKSITKKTVIPDLIELQEKFPSFYKRVFKLDHHKDLPKGLGKGEILLYFLYDDVDLAGVKQPIDIIKSGKPFLEIKVAKESKDLYYDFRLGTASRDLSQDFLENLKKLCSEYAEILPKGPDIINWSELPKRVLDYIESFGDLNDIIKQQGSFNLNLQLNEKCHVILDGIDLGSLSDVSSTSKILTEWRKKKDLSKKKKIQLSSLQKIKDKFISDLVKDERQGKPMLLLSAATGLPLKIVSLSKKNVIILRISTGQVRIGIKRADQTSKEDNVGITQSSPLHGSQYVPEPNSSGDSNSSHC